MKQNEPILNGSTTVFISDTTFMTVIESGKQQLLQSLSERTG
jgi:hypothetical protein